MLHIYLKYASYWLHIRSKYGYEGDLTTLASRLIVPRILPWETSVMMLKFFSSLIFMMLGWGGGQQADFVPNVLLHN